LRTDNRGEYTSAEFLDFYKEAGIRREKTVPYNPQQNGVAERKNRSIITVVKAMIHDQSLPLFCGQKPAIQLCTCRTGAHTGSWRTRHRRKHSLADDLR
jgi:transposase InsO family protein